MTANDVDPRMYTTVLREMIRHENDVTNHRIMWLLIAQGLIANAYVGASHGSRTAAAALAAVGILITLSTFLILYKSYHARGYLEFLGRAAKTGRLPESMLPMLGWPRERVKDWRRGFWICPWLATVDDLLEPYLFLPLLLALSWLTVLCRQYLEMERQWMLPACALGTIILLGIPTLVWVRRQQKWEVLPFPPTPVHSDAPLP
jgi:hypothetical protein